MKLSLVKGILLLLGTFFMNFASTQTFWVENFGSGCNTGTLANGETTVNGTWSVTATGANGPDANIWYISAAENGQGAGNCGAGCGTKPTLHIGPAISDLGAAYLADGSGFGGDVTTDIRAESPTIDCSDQCNIELSFEYIENGDGTNDNHILWYFDGTTWSVLDDTPKTPLTCAPQGEWTAYSFNLPASADNNPNVKIGFQWVNNDDGVGTDPSIAIYDIQLSTNDTEIPAITCQPTVDVYVDQTCTAPMPDLSTSSAVVVSDNCTSVASLIVTQDVLAGTLISGHLTIVPVQVLVEDYAGNTNTCSLNVRALDTIAPYLTCSSTQPAYADASCLSVLDDYTGLATINDNCDALGDIYIEQTPPSGTGISADQNVQILVRDLAGNERTCSFTVELTDTISPSVSCPSTQTQVVSPGTCDTLILDYTDQIVWNDNCTSSITNMTFQQNPSPLSTITGNTTVYLTATDEAGNSKTCDFIVAVEDIEDPSITCPANFGVATNSACDFAIVDFTGDGIVADNCSATGNIVVSQSPAIGSVSSGVGTVETITLTAQDEAGNTNSCTFEITLTDTTSPQVTCPADITQNADASCAYSVPDYTSSAFATDNCYTTGDFVFSQNVAVGTNVSAGVHQIEIFAEDPSGNVGSCTFQLTVTDNIAPVIGSCAPNQNVSLDNSCVATISDYTSLLTVNDNCDNLSDLTITQSPVSGTVISGPTNVTLTVADLAGNTSNCTFLVTPEDLISPSIICPSDTLVTVNTACDYPAPNLTSVVGGTDNCSSFGAMTITQNPLPGTNLNGPDIIQITLEDENGNTTSCNVNIIPDDTTPPVISCPSDQFVNNGTSCFYQITDYTGMATASDNCSGVVLSQTPAVGTEIGTGTHQVGIIATDVSGNADTCFFFLEVTESINPTITCPADISTCDSIINYTLLMVNDNCTGFSVNQIDVTGLTSGDVFPVGTTIQTYEVEDPSGNTATCSFNVEVFESPDEANIITPDTELCDTTSFLLNAESISSGTGQWGILSGAGNFNNPSANQTGINNLGYGTNEIIWEVSTANCGSTSDTISISVYAPPSPANTQDTLYICSDTSVNIAAGQPAVGTGTWSDVNNNVLFLNNNAPNTLAYNFDGGWNDLVWTISNGSCASNSDTLSVFAKLQANILMEDTTVCLSGEEFVLTGSPSPFGVSAIWYIIQGAAEFGTPTSSITTIGQISGGENIIVYAQKHQNCGTTLDTIIVTAEICGEYQPLLPTVITPNNDGRNDLFVVENLDILYPDCEVKIVNRWGNLVFESTGYEEPWNGTNMNEGDPLPMGTYFYRIFLNDDKGTELTGPISIIR